jgi:hypothetical protein
MNDSTTNDDDGILEIIDTPYGVCPECLGALELFEGEFYCPDCVRVGTPEEVPS